MPSSWNQNRLTEKLGIDYPVIQGPLGGLSQRLTAAVYNFGGLGPFGAHGLAPEAIKDVIAAIRSLTSKPFAMNLWVSMENEGVRTSEESAFNRSLAPLAAHLAALGAPRPAYKPYLPARFEDQARVLLDANVPVFSLIYGVPPREILEECRTKSIVTIGTATTPDEAAVLRDTGVNAIVASGFEAGGHRGSFLRPAEDSLTGTFSLVPQIVDIVDVPVIAAGGIGDARGVVAALALGADGVQLGTAFLACEESGASRLHRQALLGRTAGHTALTRGFTGRLARGIHNRLMEELKPKEKRDIALPTAAKARQKPVDRGGGGGPIGPFVSMGWSKRQSFQIYRRISLLQLVGEGSLPNRRARHSVECKSKSETFEFLTRRTRTMAPSGIQGKVIVITGASSGLGERTAKPHRAGLLKAMKIGTIARGGATLFLIGVAVSHLQGQEGAKMHMSNSVSYRTVKVDGLSIFFRDAGPRDGPTILLLHGLPSSSRMFEPLFARLTDRYHLVAPDYPGFGHSDWPDPKTFAYTFDHYAEIMNHFTEVLGLSRYALYMQDYGGPVGFRMALAHPDRIEALIVQDAVSHNEGLGATWKPRRAFWADRAANESTLRTNLLSLVTTRTRHVGNDPNVERYDPDLWTDEFAFLSQPGQGDIQSDLFYDYRTNVDSYPKWQAWMRERRPRLLVLWGKYDLSFELSEPEAYRRDVPKAEVHVLDAGHFALDTKADEIAALVGQFLKAHK